LRRLHYFRALLPLWSEGPLPLSLQPTSSTVRLGLATLFYAEVAVAGGDGVQGTSRGGAKWNIPTHGHTTIFVQPLQSVVHLSASWFTVLSLSDTAVRTDLRPPSDHGLLYTRCYYIGLHGQTSVNTAASSLLSHLDAVSLAGSWTMARCINHIFTH